MKRTSCTSYEKLEQAKLPQKKLLSENLFKNSNSLKKRKTHVLPRPQHRERCKRERKREKELCVSQDARKHEYR